MSNHKSDEIGKENCFKNNPWAHTLRVGFLSLAPKLTNLEAATLAVVKEQCVDSRSRTVSFDRRSVLYKVLKGVKELEARFGSGHASIGVGGDLH
jgi:hypothetical protein